MSLDLFQGDVLTPESTIVEAAVADMTLTGMEILATPPAGYRLILQRLYLTVNVAAGGAFFLKWSAAEWHKCPGGLGDHYNFDFYSYGYVAPAINRNLNMDVVGLGSIVSYVVAYQIREG